MSKTAKIILIGAGGHARVIADIISCMAENGERVELIGYADPDPKLKGQSIAAKPVLGSDNDLKILAEEHSITHFVVALGLMKGGNKLRENLYNMALSASILPITLIHPTACLANNVIIGRGSVLMAGVIVNSDTTIGENAIINTGGVLEHDVTISDHTHIAPRSTILGGCMIGDTCMIGAGSVVIQNTKIHDNVTVAAGAVVVADVLKGGIVLL